jgi:RimJ/RimL family protein N-acetyltransferase
MRAATPDDALDLLAWRNDPATRAMSRNAGVIAREAHLQWYEAALQDRAKLLLVGCVEGEAVGMARFDLLAPGRWEVSINLDPAKRGRGLSRPLLAAALAELETRRPEVVVAEIKPANAVSRHLFESLGFRHVSRDADMDSYQLVPRRSG